MDILGASPLSIENRTSSYSSTTGLPRSSGWHGNNFGSQVFSKSGTFAIRGYDLSNTYLAPLYNTKYYEFTQEDLKELRTGIVRFSNIKHFLTAEYKASTSKCGLYYIIYIDGIYTSYTVLVDLQRLSNNVQLELPLANNIVYACLFTNVATYAKVYDGLIWDGFKSKQFYDGITLVPDSRGGGTIQNSSNISSDWMGVADNFKYSFSLPSSASGGNVEFTIKFEIPYTDTFKKINISRSRTYPMYLYAFIDDLNGMLSTYEFTWRLSTDNSYRPLNLSSTGYVQVDPLNMLRASITRPNNVRFDTLNPNEQDTPVLSAALTFRAIHSLGTYTYNLNFNVAMLITDAILTKGTFLEYMQTHSIYNTKMEFPKVSIN